MAAKRKTAAGKRATGTDYSFPSDGKSSRVLLALEEALKAQTKPETFPEIFDRFWANYRTQVSANTSSEIARLRCHDYLSSMVVDGKVVKDLQAKTFRWVKKG